MSMDSAWMWGSVQWVHNNQDWGAPLYMNHRPQPPVPTPLILFIGVVAVSFSAILIKWSTAPASVIGMYRLVLTVLMMCPFLIGRTKAFLQISKREYVILALSGLFLGLHFLFWIGSLKYTSVASSMIIISLEPIFVMIGAYMLFRERTSLKGALCTAIAIVGAALVAWGDIGVSGSALFGDALSLLGTIAVSGYMLAGQSLRGSMPSFHYNFIVFIIASLIQCVYNLFARIQMVDYSLHEWLLFLLLAIIPTVFGHLLFNWLLKYVNAAVISMSILGEPVGAMILAYFLLGEHTTASQIAGGVLCIVGVSLFIRFGQSHPSAEAVKDAVDENGIIPQSGN
jgi:drug/metabolite transporter (DMT)-like permease